MNKIALESLIMDLKRVALGYHRGSMVMAKRFSEESLKRKQEIDQAQVKPYIRSILNQLEHLFQNENISKISEDALMFSTLLQNYIRVSTK